MLEGTIVGTLLGPYTLHVSYSLFVPGFSFFRNNYGSTAEVRPTYVRLLL